jgi:hypothetical protein
MSIPDPAHITPESIFIQLESDDGYHFKMIQTACQDWRLSASAFFFQTYVDESDLEEGTWEPKGLIERIFIEKGELKGELTSGQYEIILDIFNELNEAKSFTRFNQDLFIKFH